MKQPLAPFLHLLTCTQAIKWRMIHGSFAIFLSYILGCYIVHSPICKKVIMLFDIIIRIICTSATRYIY